MLTECKNSLSQSAIKETNKSEIHPKDESIGFTTISNLPRNNPKRMDLHNIENTFSQNEEEFKCEEVS